VRWRVAVLVAVAVVVLVWRPAGAHMRAASLLARFSDPDARGGIGAIEDHPVDEAATSVPLGGGRMAAGRAYTPRGVERPPRVVLVHGVHRLGIEEPRLVRFARTIAATGVEVLTPQVDELVDYRIEPASIETIGATAAWLHATDPDRPVGVMGLSFAGGLSLLAAADPRYSGDIAFVVAIGAHDDLGRVLRFFATNTVEHPDGSTSPFRAHDYGPLVLAYSHAEAFFPAEDAGVARDVLRLCLRDDWDGARARAKDLSPPSRAKVEGLFDRKVDALVPDMLRVIREDGPALEAVSPHGRLKSLRAPVFLLHGAGDNVIPPTETEWLARELPEGVRRDVLVSDAIQHVELHGEPSLGDKLALVHFMADVLEATE
jgi:pimeloyl-ACP methyl ester carboxylesterase